MFEHRLVSGGTRKDSFSIHVYGKTVAASYTAAGPKVHAEHQKYQCRHIVAGKPITSVLEGGLFTLREIENCAPEFPDASVCKREYDFRLYAYTNAFDH